MCCNKHRICTSTIHKRLFVSISEQNRFYSLFILYTHWRRRYTHTLCIMYNNFEVAIYLLKKKTEHLYIYYIHLKLDNTVEPNRNMNHTNNNTNNKKLQNHFVLAMAGSVCTALHERKFSLCVQSCRRRFCCCCRRRLLIKTIGPPGSHVWICAQGYIIY